MCELRSQNLRCHKARSARLPNLCVNKTKVNDDRTILHISLSFPDVDHNVLGLEVSVEDSFAVKEADSFQKALEEVNPLHI